MLTGVLVDVSGSMKTSLQLNANPSDEQLTRAKSIFTTLITIAEREVNSKNNQEIFVLAFGLYDITTCDLLCLLEKTKSLNKNENGYNLLNNLLADNGAPYADEYMRKHLNKEQAGFFYNFFSKNLSLLREVIDELPAVCKNASLNVVFENTTSFVNWLPDSLNPIKKAEKDYADTAIKKAFNIIRKSYVDELKAMQQPKIKSLKSTIDLLNEVSGNASKGKSFSAKELTNLVSCIEPFIYGETPMCEALGSAINVFNSITHNDKVLFMLTDGIATDGNPVKFANELRDKGILVFVCLLTSENIQHPRRLYYEAERNWTKAQRDMFELSTTLENTHSAMAVLLEQGWELSDKGHSRLFIQANHPVVLDEFTTLARRMMESNDALLNIFGRVKLDQYINYKISKFTPNLQIGGTCYANAVAAVFHLAMERIVGREGGVPKFEDICNKLIIEYGKEGAYVTSVLSEWAPKYRLKYEKVDELRARQAINKRRPVVATFVLYEQEWTAFGEFYYKNPTGILEKKDLGTHINLTNPAGHAVVLIGCDPHALNFMNSWGAKWANGGFFKVRNHSVLKLEFYDIYWTENELKKGEIKAFEQKKRRYGEDFIRELPSSLKNLPYECPLCYKSSPALQYIGNLIEAKCPKCKRNFKPTPLGFVLNS